MDAIGSGLSGESSTTLADNIMHFGRLLRAAGLRVGTGQIAIATEAVMRAGIRERDQLYWSLHCAFVKRPSERETFDQAFAIFWRDPRFLQRMMSLMIPQTTAPNAPEQSRDLMRRLSEALSDNSAQPGQKPQTIELDAVETYSSASLDRTKDFAQMTAQELTAVYREVETLALLRYRRRTRRFEPSTRGSRIDLRRVLRETCAKGPDHLLLQHRRPQRRRPPLVILCDISGSMEQYARVLLHFVYAVTADHDRVACFLFATSLHNVTRKLKSRDPDIAISAIGNEVRDWSGGTRIGACLADFNQHWARRVLAGNAQVLLFTDGLDREGGDGMDRQVRRLSASCRRLIWVNPLLRYDRYEPTASGARILDQYASELRSCHNVDTLTDLLKALS